MSGNTSTTRTGGPLRKGGPSCSAAGCLRRSFSTVSIAPTKTTADGVRLDSAFRIPLDRTVDADVVRAALRIEPAVPGELSAGATDHELVYLPDDPLVGHPRVLLSPHAAYLSPASARFRMIPRRWRSEPS